MRSEPNKQQLCIHRNSLASALVEWSAVVEELGEEPQAGVWRARSLGDVGIDRYE